MTVRDRWVELRGVRFHFRQWSGDRHKSALEQGHTSESYSQRLPIVLLHGLSSQSHIFDLVAPLLAKDFSVYALDQRGHGESGKPASGYDLPNIAEDLSAFLDAEKIRRAVILGHSWGGNVALQFGIQYPRRAAGLVLVDGGFLDLQLDPEMTWERTREMLAPPRLAGLGVETFRSMIRDHQGGDIKPEVEGIILRNFEILPDETIRPHLSFENHIKVLRGMWEQRPTLLLPDLKCPALFIPAQPDTRDPRELAFVAAKRRALQVVQEMRAPHEVIWFKDTVHDIPLQRPRKLANAISRFALGLSQK